ncbi:MAG: isocitrate lyase/PEP mutase family protein [Pseudomonadota bacterium]
MLKERLGQPGLLVAPGVYDALTAVLAVRSGFETVFVSGAALAYTRLGRPDIGLLTAVELADAVSNICERVHAPVCVDADNGFGHAFHVARTVRQLERAGAAMIQLEDQRMSKGLDSDVPRPLVTTELMVGKIKAALDARHHASTLISARTDALPSLGMSAAVERAHAYRDAGADLLFIESVKTLEEIAALEALIREVAPTPVVFNRLEAMRAPSAADLDALGVKLLLRPDALINAMTRAGASLLSAEADALLGQSRSTPTPASAAAAIDGAPYLADGLRFTDSKPAL